MQSCHLPSAKAKMMLNIWEISWLYIFLNTQLVTILLRASPTSEFHHSKSLTKKAKISLKSFFFFFLKAAVGSLDKKKNKSMDLLQLAAKEEKTINTLHLGTQRNICTWETDSWATVIGMLAAKPALNGMKRVVGQATLALLSHHFHKHFLTQNILPVTQRNCFHCKWNPSAISRIDFRNLLTSHRKNKIKSISFKPEEHCRGFQAA